MVLVLDGSALNMRRLELALAGRILEEGRALVIAVIVQYILHTDRERKGEKEFK